MHRLSVLTVALGMAIGGSSWSATAAAQSAPATPPQAAAPPSPSIAKDSRCFELRTYYAAPGKIEALHARFRDHTTRIFKKHGMDIVGYWVPKDKPDTLVYVLIHKSREAADASWKAFRSDPEWMAARKASEDSAGGSLTTKVEFVFMDATDYSPLK
jgi:hypothetical protein